MQYLNINETMRHGQMTKIELSGHKHSHQQISVKNGLCAREAADILFKI